MKSAKRLACILLAVGMVLSLAACTTWSLSGKQAQQAESGRSLYEHGMEIVAMLSEMAQNEDYVQLLISSPEVISLLADLGQGDFSQPSAVYQITASLDAIVSLFEEEDPGFSLNQLSPAVREMWESRLLSILVNQVNAQYGSTFLAACSVCSASQLFVSRELTENMIYLYAFPNAAPVAVTFIKGENGAVSASGMFLSADPYEIRLIFETFSDAFGIKIKEITP